MSFSDDYDLGAVGPVLPPTWNGFQFGLGIDDTDPPVFNTAIPMPWETIERFSKWWPHAESLEETYQIYTDSSKMQLENIPYFTWNDKPDSFPKLYVADPDDPTKMCCIESVRVTAVVIQISSPKHKSGRFKPKCKKTQITVKEHEFITRSEVVDNCTECRNGNLNGSIPGQPIVWRPHFEAGKGIYNSNILAHPDLLALNDESTSPHQFNIFNPCTYLNKDAVIDRYPPPQDHPANQDNDIILVFRKAEKFAYCGPQYQVLAEIKSGREWDRSTQELIRLVHAQFNSKDLECSRISTNEIQENANFLGWDILRCMCQLLEKAKTDHPDDYQAWVNQMSQNQMFDGGINQNTGMDNPDYNPHGQGFLDDETLDGRVNPDNKYLQAVRDCFDRLMQSILNSAAKNNMAPTDTSIYPNYPRGAINFNNPPWNPPPAWEFGDYDAEKDRGWFATKFNVDLTDKATKVRVLLPKSKGYELCRCRGDWGIESPDIPRK